MTRLRGFVAAAGKSALLMTAALTIACPVAAQSRFEIGGGVTWSGGFDAGGKDALLSRDAATPFTLFQTSTRLESAPGVVVRAAVRLSSHIAIEGTAEFSRPTLRTTISNDFEQATGTEASTTVSSYLFGGSLLYRFADRRLAPFARAGAGALRQLDDGNVTLVTGIELHAGGGLTYRLTPHVAVRADAALSSRDKSIAFEEKRRSLPVVSASLAYRF